MNPIDESQRITADERGNWQYPSAAASGYVEVELPALPGATTAVERLHVRDLGIHIAGKIEKRINQQGYLKSGPQQGPAQIFRHYVGAAKGASLMDDGTFKQMSDIASQFESEPNQAEFFSKVVRPYLHSLSPKRR